MINAVIKYFLENKLVTFLVLLILIFWGIVTAPFGWKIPGFPSDPVPVDAIPDIGENQQIVFTEWPGRSPQDVEDQVTYPLTTFLLGTPGVKSIRSTSMFGFSSIYVIFNDNVEFYWSRSRLLEKLNAIPPGLLPEGVRPTLGPDATALGQVFWYTLEGRDSQGNPTGGWDLHEIRTVQDFYVKYALNAVEGVSEVASVGGFVKEYQIDIRPEAVRAYDIRMEQVIQAVRNSNRDVGASTIEVNQVEYFVRGLGYIHNLKDLEESVVAVRDNTPIHLKDIAHITYGPAIRRGALDKDGVEAVGGVVVVRYGANPLEVIRKIKQKIDEISPGLPKKVLPDGTVSQLTIVPFYDRTGLIYETLGTLEEALRLEVLVTILVILILIINLRSSIVISSLLPIAVLMTFIAMRHFGVDANVVALSGIAIAIGTMVDMGIILSENVIKKMDESSPDEPLIRIVYEGAAEVSSAIVTAVSTTIVSFIPVFTLQAAEGKLFRPLAFTKTFALVASLIVALLFLPSFLHLLFGIRVRSENLKKWLNMLLIPAGLVAFFQGLTWVGLMLTGIAGIYFVRPMWKASRFSSRSYLVLFFRYGEFIVIVFSVLWLLASYWLPLGAGKSIWLNFFFVLFLVGSVIAFFIILQIYYTRILAWCLRNKGKFLMIPAFFIFMGLNIWFGFPRMFGWLSRATETIGINIRQNSVWSFFAHTFPGIGSEFMPSLDEGSFLLMPTSMPHSGVEYNLKVVGYLDKLVSSIPEVEITVGKMGRVESALDPAPISMFENVILYKPEYVLDQKGHRMRFKTDGSGRFILKNGEKKTNEEILNAGISTDQLIPDKNGRYFRNWRSHIHSPDDIWNEIVKITNIPGVTSAPRLQPIETRLVMLQTGMRAPMGIKVFGPDLTTIEEFGLKLEQILKEVPSVKGESVFADRIVGKPYIHLVIDRPAIARYGLRVEDVQQMIEVLIGGKKISTTVEGRERYPIRIRYPREYRDEPEKLLKVLIPTPTGAQIPLGQLVRLEFVRGPQMIKSENTFLVGYVIFDKKEGYSEVEVVNEARETIARKIRQGDLDVPAGITFTFSGNYENQVRAAQRLSLIIPIVLMIIFLILYFQFRSVTTSIMVFTGVFMAFSGGFLMLWLYGQDWFLNFSFFGTNIRTLFQVDTVYLSVAVWVGFIALFGLATDDGVLMATYLDQSFASSKPGTIDDIRSAVIEGAARRIRPAVMTSLTTIIALLPVLTSTGKGSDIMVPMAIPTFGGMTVAAITYFLVPTLYSWREEKKLKRNAL